MPYELAKAWQGKLPRIFFFLIICFYTMQAQTDSFLCK